MKTEYKRDMNHNYLILYGEEEINTDSYQVRMLVGNIIPSLLKCRIQGMDGKFMVYFDITSRQALNRLYEEKKGDRRSETHFRRIRKGDGRYRRVSDESGTAGTGTGIHLYRYGRGAGLFLPDAWI